MKNLIYTIVVSTLILFKMEAQNTQTVTTSNFKLQVYNASENSFGVASVIVSGKEDAILIDAQFTLEDAEKVASEIKASGKNLKTIFVSHGDPDFYFGLQVFKNHFPDVTVYAAPATVEHIKVTAQKKLDVWGGKLGDLITSNVVLPQVLKGSSLELEGEKLEIIGLEDFATKTFVYIPSSKAVIGGINVFSDSFHPWMADAQTTEARTNWIKVLDKITSLQPSVVIPAHGNASTQLNLTSVQHTKDYIKFYENALKAKPKSVELIKILKKQYPTATFETALQIGAKVNTGEMKW
ncbi:MBL fold metallo-hydrolase [Cellulophaga fucicola]|uniref:Glyoxylase, beta-lactamase superfamily II n=1 Tax=Cellulophaga fucicola TaxID=76595 RepID=A0A1K1PIP2_9FLAO|nr:MBL fold metallo-hydrolase [Cellulophaga fucicola]SFW47329.1 Glyoxylase, beta-lactamase superfamily II [Cellulophaga fucicola]